MIISHSHKFVFIHVPKTAGTSVMKALLPYASKRQKFSQFIVTKKIVKLAAHALSRRENPGAGLNYEHVHNLNRRIAGAHAHGTRQDLKEFLGPQRWQDYFSFAFVRNPYELQISLYEYVRRTPVHFDWAEANRLTFREFVLRNVEGDGRIQSDYVVDENGEIGVSYLGRMETIADDFRHIAQTLNLPNPELRTLNNAKQRPALKDYYDAETAEALFNHQRRDFELFGYSPDIEL